MRNAQFARLAKEWGIHLLAQDFMPADFAMDAQPAAVLAPNAGVPVFLTQFFDPEAIRIVQSPNKGAEILGEKKEGDWTKETAIFIAVENVGEVGPYGDYSENGRTEVTATYPQRQAFLFQTHIEYGDREVDLMATTALSWVAEKQRAAALTLDKYLDYTYHFGVAGLQNYGVMNDPYLSAALTPATKAYNGVKWINNGVPVASANEVMADVQALYSQAVSQGNGVFDMGSAMKLIMPPSMEVALGITNQFGITARDMIQKVFPRLKFVTDFRYATSGGNLIQLIADQWNGADTGFCAFNEKMRQHRLIPETSSYRQKMTSGSWGAIIRYPLAFAQMLGV